MPFRRAAGGLPPMARISKPHRVYFMNSQKTTNSPRAIRKLRSIRVPKKVGRRPAGTKLAVILVSRGACQKPKTKKETMDGATELSSSDVIVSLTKPMDLRYPGMNAHKAPP